MEAYLLRFKLLRSKPGGFLNILDAKVLSRCSFAGINRSCIVVRVKHTLLLYHSSTPNTPSTPAKFAFNLD